MNTISIPPSELRPGDKFITPMGRTLVTLASIKPAPSMKGVWLAETKELGMVLHLYSSRNVEVAR